jgi:long-chain acyl-CoA synthetase
LRENATDDCPHHAPGATVSAMNISKLLRASSRILPHRPAIKEGTRPIATFAELADRVARMANAILALSGGTPGARIVIFSANCPQYLETLWAAWWAGLCVVPVNAKLHPRELSYIVDDAGATICFVDEGHVAALNAGDLFENSVRIISFDSEDYALLAASPSIPIMEVGENDLAWLFYTSGTTGKPKGAMLSHRSLFAMTLRQYADLGPITERDSIIHAAPISHASGLFSIGYVAKGACNVVPQSGAFREDEIIDLINSGCSCSMFLAPTMVNRLVRHPDISACDLSRLRYIIYGGAPMYLDDIKKALRILAGRLLQIYGQGETPNTISFLSSESHINIPANRIEAVLNSVGVPRTGIEIRIVDDAERDVATGQIGQILVKSDVTMTGYWNNTSASQAALRDGWLRTGDLGCFDEFGFLSLKDRAKDVIISGGSNIYPREIEEIVLLHEGVLEVSVIGRPSAEWGEEVVAFVVRKDSSQVSWHELDTLCLQHVARFKRPKAYCFIDQLPKNNYGKILKTALRDWIGIAKFTIDEVHEARPGR